MSIVQFYDQLGRGGMVRANNYDVFPSPTDLRFDNNEYVRSYDWDTYLITGTFNNGQFGTGIYVDYVTSTILEIDSLYLFNSGGDPLISIYDVNIRFNIYDDFSSGISFSNMYSSNDEMIGNRYSDYIEAGLGQDTVYGNSGNDTLLGDGGNDWLAGGAGSDKLIGGVGVDSLVGGAGKDSLIGGLSGDSFIFDAVRDSGATSSSADVIIDFDRRYDMIDLSLIDASIVRSGNNQFVFRGTSRFTASADGEVRYQKFNNSGTANDYTMVFIDNDRDTQAEMAIRIRGLHSLTVDDFWL